MCNMEVSNPSAVFAGHIRTLLHVCATPVDPRDARRIPCRIPGADICAICPHRENAPVSTHCYGVREASRWNSRYIYYCPMGLAFHACVRLNADFALTGAVITGPMLMGDLQDLSAEMEPGAFRSALSALPAVTPAEMRSLSELSAAAFSALPAGASEESGAGDQQDLLNLLESMREGRSAAETESDAAILAVENELKQAVRDLDKARAQKLLNELLCKLYLQNAFDLETVKARSIELIVILSRTVIDAGADVGQVFLFNAERLRRIGAMDSVETLYSWMSELLHAFIDDLFNYSGIKHADTVYKTMEYIRTNCGKKLTLDDIARHVYMSRAYLSMLFKQETGHGISEYITQVRVEKSKHLLRDTNMPIAEIAAECCFHDQSYFTKVFQRMTGMSPRKFRTLC